MEEIQDDKANAKYSGNMYLLQGSELKLVILSRFF